MRTKKADNPANRVLLSSNKTTTISSNDGINHVNKLASHVGKGWLCIALWNAAKSKSLLKLE